MSVLRLIPTKGEATVVDADEALVGREANCNVVVPHPSVSRRHALLKRKQDVFFVVDQGSANGTFVDSKRVVDAALREGSVLRFGSAAFKVEIKDDLQVESVAEDELVVSQTMVGHAPQSFSATVVDEAPIEETTPGEMQRSEPEPAPTVQAPILRPPPRPEARPEPRSEPRPEPARSAYSPTVQAPAAALPVAPHPIAGTVPNRGVSFWLLVGAGGLALLIVGAALGLGAAFLARRMGLL